MRTRSEALLEALQQVDSSITGTNERVSEAMDILERNSNEHASAMRESAEMHSKGLTSAAETIKEAAEIHGKSLEEAANRLFDGLLLVGALAVACSAINARSQSMFAAQRVIEMFGSTYLLQQKYGAMTYNFVLKRTYVTNSTKSERRTLLNGLIMSGIIQDNYQNNPNLLFIDDDSTNVIEFRKQVKKLLRIR